MPVFTIQNLIDRAVAISDMHDSFVKPSEWLAWYNQERRALSLFMARQGAGMNNLSFQTTVGADLLTINQEILAIVGVWEITSSGRYRPLKIVNFPSNFKQGQGGPVTGPSQFISIEDTNLTTISSVTLRFYPRDTSGTYIIAFAQIPATAFATVDTTSLPMGLEERIVLGMARRALIKEESDTSDVDKLIKEQDSLAEEYVWSRALAQSPSVRNVDFEQRGWQSELVFPHPDLWAWL